MKSSTRQKIHLQENINLNFEIYRFNKTKLKRNRNKLTIFCSFRRMNLKNENKI